MIYNIIISATIYILIPLIGLCAFLRLRKKMKIEGIMTPPVIDFFLIFATYGGLLLVLLTTIFLEWSGMTSLGTLYLILGAPIVMGGISYRQYKKRDLSNYHKRAFQVGFSYFIIAPLTFIILYLIK